MAGGDTNWKHSVSNGMKSCHCSPVFSDTPPLRECLPFGPDELSLIYVPIGCEIN